MTQKMTKIIENYKEKQEINYLAYKHNHCTFSEFQKNTHYECTRLERMISDMYHFDMISENDFFEATHIPSNICFEIVDRAIYS